MTSPSAAFAARLAGALDASPSPVPVLVGGCGSGRTSALLALREALGPTRCQYVDVERIATTPERFLRAVIAHSPFKAGPHIDPAAVRAPREAFDAGLAFLASACTAEGGPATFLLDEVLDLRTFESFPGLRTTLADLAAALNASPNRFVLASRFGARATRLVRAAGGRLELHPAPHFTPAETEQVLAETPHRLAPGATDRELASAIHAVTGGRPAYVRAILEAMSSMGEAGGADPVGALAASLAPGGPLARLCRFSYELRLHRARGYGALKAILDVLAEEEPLTLTAIARRLGRTPGSTKDYLGWLEDVDLVQVDRKQYRFADPVLRVWVRLNGRPTPPSDEDVAREVRRFAVARLGVASPREPAGMAAAGPRRRDSGIIELD
jgi:hypothetical protein